MLDKFILRRKGVSFIGNIDKPGTIVKVKSIDSKNRICEITDGYYNDIVPMKELLKYKEVN